MVDSCGTCFFSRNVVDQNGFAYLGCCHEAPAVVSSHLDASAISAQWSKVQSDWWCGDGADKTTGASFSDFVQTKAAPVWITTNPEGEQVKVTHLTNTGNYLIKTGSGFITDISVNTPANSGTLTIYDGVNASGAVLAVIDVSKNTQSGSGSSPWPFATGLFAVLNGNADVTILSTI